ncbi:hypothetical protein A2U01_0045287, partial [Trifolium medium]|nr:hypothetical protein [Trifolium medium]
MGGIGTMNNRGFYGFGIRYDNANSNNFGLNVGDQNTNLNFGSLAHENFGLVQGGFGSLSYARGENGSEFREQLFKEKNVSENREIPLQKSNRNIIQYEQNHNGGTSTNVPEFNISNFSMADDMDLLDK